MTGQLKHPLGEWIELRYPGTVCEVFWTREGLFVKTLIVPPEAQARGLFGQTGKILAEFRRYALYSGESILSIPGPPPGYSVNRERLRKVYERYGAVWCERRGKLVFPPWRANTRYEQLARGVEKYEGIL